MHTRQTILPGSWTAKVLAQMDEILKNGETSKYGAFLLADKNEDRNVFTRFIQENTHIMKELPGDQPHPDTLQMDQPNKKRFLTILFRLAKEWDGISRQERIFLHQFWSGLQRDQCTS